MKSNIRVLGVSVLLMAALGAPAIPLLAQDDAPPWPTEEWATSTPNEQGMDSEVLVEMLQYLQDEYANIYSFLVVRNGVLVLEMYNHPFEADRRYAIGGATKSIVATLVGAAIGEGYIAGVDDLVLDYFPERTVANLDDDKAALTVGHLLTMTAGFPDPGVKDVQTILDLPMRRPPGTRFEYNTGASHLLSAVVVQASGMDGLDFIRQKLFEPLGISEWDWPVDSDGVPHGSTTLALTPRDMAKIGYLYLNEGVWDGEQVLPAEYVAQASSPHVVETPDWAEPFDYGYQWWVNAEDGYYAAIGGRTNWIAVFPELNVVVVTTGPGAPVGDPQFVAFQEYVIPAAVTTDPLPANPEAVEAMEAVIEAFAQPQ